MVRLLPKRRTNGTLRRQKGAMDTFWHGSSGFPFQSWSSSHCCAAVPDQRFSRGQIDGDNYYCRSASWRARGEHPVMRWGAVFAGWFVAMGTATILNVSG